MAKDIKETARLYGVSEEEATNLIDNPLEQAALGTGEFLSKLAYGIPEALYKKLAGSENVKRLEELRSKYPTTSALAGGAGSIANFFVPEGKVS